MGGAPDSQRLRTLADLIRSTIGPAGVTLSHTCDVLIEEICRCWPDKTMESIAANPTSQENCDAVLAAIDVISAKVRENIEARWGCRPSHRAALDLVLRACVIQFAKIWFESPADRAVMGRLINSVRKGKIRLD